MMRVRFSSPALYQRKRPRSGFSSVSSELFKNVERRGAQEQIVAFGPSRRCKPEISSSIISSSHCATEDLNTWMLSIFFVIDAQKRCASVPFTEGRDHEFG